MHVLGGSWIYSRYFTSLSVCAHSLNTICRRTHNGILPSCKNLIRIIYSPPTPNKINSGVLRRGVEHKPPLSLDTNKRTHHMIVRLKGG